MALSLSHPEPLQRGGGSRGLCSLWRPMEEEGGERCCCEQEARRRVRACHCKWSRRRPAAKRTIANSSMAPDRQRAMLYCQGKQTKATHELSVRRRAHWSLKKFHLKYQMPCNHEKIRCDAHPFSPSLPLHCSKTTPPQLRVRQASPHHLHSQERHFH